MMFCYIKKNKGLNRVLFLFKVLLVSKLKSKPLNCDGLGNIKRVRRLYSLCRWAFYLQLKAMLL